MLRFETIELTQDYQRLAPDCSEIRFLPEMNGGGLAHCTLRAGGISKPIYHRTVEEIWYCLEGEGEVWRKQDDREEVTRFVPGVSLTIPKRTRFQFRNQGDRPLRFIISTMPPWPGSSEAVTLESGYWAGWPKECDV